MNRIEYNIYCDESCHLEKNNSDIMAMGAVWCESSKRIEIFKRIREIKTKYYNKSGIELKWNRISPSCVNLYMEIVDYFFDNDDLHFRGVVVKNKKKLNHEAFNQDHDTFYYKIYFNLIKVILNPEYAYNIYIDIKDTKSQRKVVNLKNVLRSSQFDFDKAIIKRVQQVDSKDVELIQLTDLLTGALSYVNRGLSGNVGKLKMIDRIKERSNYSLDVSTLYGESKLNIFIWEPSSHGTRS